MKNRILMLLTILLAVTLLPACDGDSDATPSQLLDIQQYFTMKPNTVYVYDGGGNPYLEWTVFADYIGEDYYQRRIATPYDIIAEVIKFRDSAAILDYSEVSMNFHYNLSGEEPNVYACAMKSPLGISKKWEQFKAQGTVSMITSMSKEVTVPYGTFKAMEITTTMTDGKIQRNYYAKDIGLIMSSQEEGGVVSSAALASVSEGVLKETERFYYPGQNNEMLFEEREVEFKTNEDIRALLEAELRKPINGYYPLQSGATKINSVKRNHSERRISVDLSSEFEAGLGDLEISSLVNTIGYLFDASKVQLTVEGQRYDDSVEFYDLTI